MQRQATVRAFDQEFLARPVRLAVQTTGGPVLLEFCEGDWVAAGSVRGRDEIRRLRADNRRLGREVDSLGGRLDRAAKLAAVLQLDLRAALAAKHIVVRDAPAGAPEGAPAEPRAGAPADPQADPRTDGRGRGRRRPV